MAKFKPSAKLNFGTIDHYNPQYLANNYSPSEIRKEYSRVRAIAIKRLNRLAKAGFGETSVYKYNVFNTKKLSELTEKQIPLALSQLARFLDNPLSTVTGQKAQRKLYEMCTNCNARKFFKVMINGNVEVLPTSEGLEKYGEYKVYSFAIRGRIIEVDLDENKERRIL